MDMITGLFLLLAAWPLTVGIIGFVILTFVLWADKEGWATGVLALLCAGFLYVFWDRISVWTAIAYVFAYIVFGLMYTIPQYISFSKKMSKKWIDFKTNYMREDINNWKLKWCIDALGDEATRVSNAPYERRKPLEEILKSLTAEQTQAMQENEGSTRWEKIKEQWNAFYSKRIFMVKGDDYTTMEVDVYHDRWFLGLRMISWTLYWPAYAVLLVIDDLLTHIVDYIVLKLGGWFRSISTGHFNQPA